MGYLQDELADAIGPKWAKRFGILGAILVVYVLVALIFSIWPFSVVSGVVAKVTDPTAIISNYEWFYAMKGEIDATTAKLRAAREAGLTEAAGIEMVLSSMIQEYNARSRMTTRALWKASDLPYQIDMEVSK